MAQGFVGTGGPGNLQVSGPGFSLGPGVNIGGQGYGGQIDQLMAAERDYMPKLQKWQQEQTQRAERARKREMADLRRQMRQGQQRQASGAMRADRPMAAPAPEQEMQFMGMGKYGGQTYWGMGPKGRGDVPTGMKRNRLGGQQTSSFASPEGAGLGRSGARATGAVHRANAMRAAIENAGGIYIPEAEGQAAEGFFGGGGSGGGQPSFSQRAFQQWGSTPENSGIYGGGGG